MTKPRVQFGASFGVFRWMVSSCERWMCLLGRTKSSRLFYLVGREGTTNCMRACRMRPGVYGFVSERRKRREAQAAGWGRFIRSSSRQGQVESQSRAMLPGVAHCTQALPNVTIE